MDKALPVEYEWITAMLSSYEKMPSLLEKELDQARKELVEKEKEIERITSRLEEYKHDKEQLDQARKEVAIKEQEITEVKINIEQKDQEINKLKVKLLSREENRLSKSRTEELLKIEEQNIELIEENERLKNSALYENERLNRVMKDKERQDREVLEKLKALK